MNRRYKSLLVLLLLLMTAVASAQTKQKRMVKGTIVDFVTLDPVERVDSVEILRADSTLATKARWYDEYKYNRNNYYYSGKYVKEFTAEVPDTGTYILHVEAPDFHPFYQKFTVNSGKRQFETDLGRVELRKKAKPVDSDVNLKEVVVQATKLKFYFDGDTLVYDATAFVTDQSFTLNDALKKMPGIDIRKDGTIYSNGRKVEALLLNGKDFFNKDRKTLLDNLPAFMVKDVKIYDKTQDSLSLFKREREFRGLVMDVKMKKEYATSTIGKADVGYGTGNHYQGKLFGMKFNSLGRVSVSANLNNVNSTELQVSEYVRVSEGTMFGDDGEQRNTQTQMNYNFDHSKGLYALNGNVKINYYDAEMLLLTNTQNFYSTGDVFSRASQHRRSYDFGITSSHTWNFLGNTFWDFTLSPTLSLRHHHQRYGSISGSFNTDVMNTLGVAWEDSLRSKVLSPTLQKDGVSRTINDNRSCSDNIVGKISLNKDFKIANSDDALHLMVQGSVDKEHNRGFSQYSINQIANGNQKEWENKHNHGTNSNKLLIGRLSYDFKIFPRTTLSAFYEHTSSAGESDYSLYALHKLEGWASGTEHLLGELPHAEALASVIDNANSNRTDDRANTDEVLVKYRFDPKKESKMPDFSLQFSLPMRRSSLHYIGEQADTTVRVSLCRPKIEASLGYNWKGYSFRLSYSDEHYEPSLHSLLNIRSTATPLYVNIGNPHLRGSHIQSINFSGHYSKGLTWHSLYGYWQNTRHGQASASVYNRQTGVNTIKAVNVEGNMHFYSNLQSQFYLGNRRESEINNQLALNIQKSMSMQTAESFDDLRLYQVRNTRISENITFRQHLLKNTLMLSGALHVNYNRAISPLESFERISAWDYGFNAEVEVSLPKRFEIESSLMGISRRGYNYAQMNDNEYLWNITAKKHVKDWTLQLDVFDLLNQRKSVWYQISSTARTETFRNTLRRYAMLHVIWKINKKPKKA